MATSVDCPPLERQQYIICKDEDKILLQPYDFTIRAFTKEETLDGVIGKTMNHWLQLPEDKFQMATDLLQPAVFLIIDDIQDNAMQRKGVPAAHVVFGIDRTLTAVNYALCLQFQKLRQLQSQEAIDIYIQAGLEIYSATGIEIYWRDNMICPTEEEYRNMISLKSGGPLVAAVRFMQLFSESGHDLSKIARLIGSFIQVSNDYVNFRSKKYSKMYGYCKDLTTGTFTYPIIHAIRSHPEDDQIINVLEQRTENNEIKKYVLCLMEQYGSFKYVRQVLDEYKREIIDEMKKFGDNPMLMQLLEYCTVKLDEDVFIL